MSPNQIKKHLEIGKIQLNKWETFAHYSLLLPILLIPIISLYSGIAGKGTISRVPIFEMMMFVIAGIYIYNRYKALEFKKYRLEHTAENFKLAAEATSIELNWRIEILTDNLLIAKKYDLDSQWDGLKITIIREGNKIYSNSMVNPSMRSNPFSNAWNKKNLQVFNNNLIYATRGEKIIEKATEKLRKAKVKAANESEWTLKNIVKRIVAYLIIFILLSACALILSEGFNFIPILIIGICVGYLIMDWMLIIKKIK